MIKFPSVPRSFTRHVQARQANSCLTQSRFYLKHRGLNIQFNQRTRSTMETVKPRSNTFLTVAVILNILFSLISIGCLVYKVKVLEEQVSHCKSDSLREHQPESGEYRDENYRSKRSVESLGRTKSCSSCHNACVQLFGLGASAKVDLSKTSYV